MTVANMTVALRKPMPLPEFLAREERQELRFEFNGFEPVAMTGGPVAREMTGGTLRALLRDRLRGKPCRVVGPTMKIEVERSLAEVCKDVLLVTRADGDAVNGSSGGA